jgi:peptide/nickel transport system ATP-binding protein
MKAQANPADLIRAEAIHVALPDRGRRRLFGRTPYVDILRGVDFRIGRGETVGIVGESGSGKTTLGRVLLRLLQPSAGRLYFDGQEITAADQETLRPLRPRMQMIFQNPLSSLNPRHTIGEIVGAPIRAATARAALRDRVATALRRAELGPAYAGRYPHQLSGGERQRVGIARAIVGEPAFILADEIVSGLDVSTQAQILTLLRSLQRGMGLALALIAHDLSVVRVLCDRVVVLWQGRIVEEGTCAQVFAAPRHAYTRRLIAAIPLPEIDDGWFDRPEIGPDGDAEA